MDEPDWYCAEVFPRRIEINVVMETDSVLAFRPPVPGFGKDHVIVVPKHHVRSLLELDAALAAHLLEVVRTAARDVVARHGGSQLLGRHMVLANMGTMG
ncbi:HIT domain-containing protein [Streptomyces yanii]|uniref:HIT domain-containing protein n=1 Tax=Streptomyces yanii TaxID=78510 RepID=A0ABV5R2I6_9ACTN